jgi:hypothetical protein
MGGFSEVIGDKIGFDVSNQPSTIFIMRRSFYRCFNHRKVCKWLYSRKFSGYNFNNKWTVRLVFQEKMMQ